MTKQLKTTKRTLTIALAGILTLSAIGLLNSSAWSCEQRWITALYDCGEVVQLDDNSLWLIQDFDQHRTMGWRIGDQVDVCNDTRVIRNADHKSDWLKVKNTVNYIQKHAACERP